MHNLSDNLVALEHRIEDACRAAGRPRTSVTLIGVSKTQPLQAVRAAAALGITHLGENYLAEAIDKIAACRDLHLTWHYIGRIQSNKTRDIATWFDWVHTVDREKIARRLSDQCPPGKCLNVLVQVNIDADPAKGGVRPEQAPDLIAFINSQPNLIARGLMTIPARDADPGASYQSMAQLFTAIGEGLAEAGQWDTLSMGMTGDLEDAIAAGATHIRIGTALFGTRSTRETVTT